MKTFKNGSYRRNEYQSFAAHLYTYQEEDAIKHLFKVVAGLDSMVIGESEVLGQVKNAYKLALENKTIDSKLKRTFRIFFFCCQKYQNKYRHWRERNIIYVYIYPSHKKIFSNVEEKNCFINQCEAK